MKYSKLIELFFLHKNKPRAESKAMASGYGSRIFACEVQNNLCSSSELLKNFSGESVIDIRIVDRTWIELHARINLVLMAWRIKITLFTATFIQYTSIHQLYMYIYFIRNFFLIKYRWTSWRSWGWGATFVPSNEAKADREKAASSKVFFNLINFWSHC